MGEKEIKKNLGDDVERFEVDEPNAKIRKGTMDSFMMKGKRNVCKQQTMDEMVKKRESMVRDICRFLYGHALTFNLVKSPLFAQMMKSVGEYGRGLKLPSYHEARVTFLKNEIENVNECLIKY